ncbi:acyl-CoA N-acyltransferase [Fimicolochytrium jonesii]|uniref:acyl-CoA N-acyltransferase n=1 Tax=Fimicolochytrium jonesii TaxID=1396493 RepID=UPI0022FECACE|nr:acyl-CoA N-acyltransferase [Fimicolochytrium jonesii]KAI8825005.1 acyl-CoA N-acyltransferase [Fimicolochytrium jonesii]
MNSSEGEELVREANEVSPEKLFSECCDIQSKASSTLGTDLELHLYSLKTLPPALQQWAFNLVKENLYDEYVAAKDTGWSDEDKQREMTEPNARYIVVNTMGGDARPVGFVYFQFTMEESCDDKDEVKNDEDEDEGSEESGEDVQIPVVYCYELQISASYQHCGLGTHLMSLIEELGRRYHMLKCMLTAFKSNTAALNFYRKRGYEIDGISPSNHLPPRRAARISYEIYSKVL